MTIALVGLAAYAAVFGLWILYVAAMHLLKYRGQMGPIARAHATAAIAIAAVVDLLVNLFVASFVFLDLPRELMLTQRLRRYRRDARYLSTWRAAWATWICSRLLNQFDPKGEHC